MNWKFTLVLAAIVAALVLFFNFYEPKQAGTDDLKKDGSRVFALDRSQIDALTVTDHDQKIELARGADNKWTLKSPVADRASQSVVDEVMTNLEILRKQDTLTGKDVGKGKLADYGLQTPRARLLITARGGQQTELLFGNETVIDGKTYLQLKGLNEVYVVGDELKKLLGKDVSAWRDHRLTDLAATDVNRFVLKDATGEIELQKDAGHWKLLKPLATRADDAKVNDTISQLTNLEASSFVADDKADAAAYGLAEPRGTITLYTEKNPKGTELLVGSVPGESKATPGASPALASPAPTPSVPAGSVYVRMPSRQSVFTVANTVETVLALKPADLRDHSLVRVNDDLVDRIRLTQADGSSFTLSHKDKKWTILDGPAANQPADSEAVNRLISLLTGSNITDFVADSTTEPAKYGFDKPLLQAKLLSFSSENTAESNAGEKAIATVTFGKGDETSVFARTAEEPFVVSVPKALVDTLPTDPLQWQSKYLFQGEAGKLSSLEVAVKDRPALAMTRPDKGNWTLTSKVEGTLNTAKVDAIATTLVRLRALRWVGAAKPEYGLDQPTVVVKFASTADTKLGGRLVVGGFDPTGAYYAQVDGKPGVFTISKPDDDTFTAELVPGTVPAATPVPTVAPAPVASPAPEPTSAIPAATPTPAMDAVPAATPTPPVAAPTPAAPATPAPTASAIPEAAATPAPTPAATPEPSAPAALSPVATPAAGTPTPVATPTPE